MTPHDGESFEKDSSCDGENPHLEAKSRQLIKRRSIASRQLPSDSDISLSK